MDGSSVSLARSANDPFAESEGVVDADQPPPLSNGVQNAFGRGDVMAAAGRDAPSRVARRGLPSRTRC